MSSSRLFVLFLCVLGALSFNIKAEDLEQYQFKGNHFLASYCECNLEALENVEDLIQVMKEAVMQSGATLLDSCSWVFPPNGLTMVFLLSESHASIHTYPEHGACFIDLFTCGEHCSAEKFDEALRAYLKPKSVSVQTLIRNETIQQK